MSDYFLHQDGGLYLKLYKATSTVSLESVVVYRHVFPFEAKIWVRASTEWTSDRFKPVSIAEAYKLMELNRAEYQATVTASKKARKG